MRASANHDGRLDEGCWWGTIILRDVHLARGTLRRDKPQQGSTWHTRKSHTRTHAHKHALTSIADTQGGQGCTVCVCVGGGFGVYS